MTNSYFFITPKEAECPTCKGWVFIEKYTREYNIGTYYEDCPDCELTGLMAIPMRDLQ